MGIHDYMEVLAMVLVVGAAGGIALVLIDLAAGALRWLARGLVGTWCAFWRVPR